MKLVIIAAGQGSRLRSEINSRPKALTTIHEHTIIDVILNNCMVNGINDILIITGYDKSSIKNYITGRWASLNIDFIHNQDWKLENGLSVLKAKPCIDYDEEFMISMSDHLYFSDLMKKIKKSNLSNTIVNVGLDYNINDIFDIDDGMKVLVQPKTMLVKAMSKNLTTYNAIDVGLFKCNYNFFSYLEKLNENAPCSLSSGCNKLIEKNLLGGVNIHTSFWIDIDTPDALEFARNNKKVLELINNQNLN